MPPDEDADDARRRTIETTVLVVLAIAFVAVSLAVQKPWSVGWDKLPAVVGVIIGAGLTLIMYSFLYRDNPLFKIAENLYVGVALGYMMIRMWRDSLRPEIYDPLLAAPTSGAFAEALLHRTVPIVLGLLLLTRLSKKRGWLSRYSYGPLVGWGAGVGIVVQTHTNILKQLGAAIKPLQGTAASPAGSWAWIGAVALPVLGSLLLLVGTIAVLFYFFFSIKHKRVGGVVSRVGILFLMVSFGASFGYTVMGRLSLLIGRARFLLFEWLKLPT